MQKNFTALLERGVEEIIEKEHLTNALASGKKLRVKFGIDPTAPDLHLGHTVVLRKLRQFQKLGHTVVLIIGDFTGRIGDPSGKTETRKPLSEKEIKINLKNYLAQAGKVLDIKKTEVRYNSEWLEKKGLVIMLEIVKSIGVQQTLKREDFQKRIAKGNEITILEIMYPLFQGYDSVAVKANVELGGTDQKFNLLMGRRIQRHFGMPEQDIMTLPLIEGTDGMRKMSKSYGNYIGIAEPPNEMFGKIMSVTDALIAKYFTLLTDIDPPRANNPYQNKLLLAETIVGIYHSPAAAKKARETFIGVFSKKEIPNDIKTLQIADCKLQIIDLLIAAGIKSKSEARRLILQKAVEIDRKIKNDPLEKINFSGGEVLKIGKKKFYKISI